MAVPELWTLGHTSMHIGLIFLVLLYWAVCCGLYYLAALAFVSIMGSLVRVPKGWLRNALWLFFYTPVRLLVVLFPYGLAFVLFYVQQTRDLVVFVLVNLCFFASLMPAWQYVRKHRQFILEVIRQ